MKPPLNRLKELTFDELVSNNIVLFFVLFALGILLYFPSLNGRFVGDIYYYFDGIEKQGFKGFLTSFDIIHQNQVPSFFIYFLYKLFGYNWVGWFLFYTGIHALNAFLIIKLVRYHLPKYAIIALFSGLLFLASPFQSEAVVWAACLHYLLCLTFLFTALICIRKYYEQPNFKWVLFFGLSYLASLLCYEQAYVFPGVFFFYYLILIQNKFDFKKTLKFSFSFMLICVLLIGFHILLNKIIYGHLIGHYGSEAHVNFKIWLRLKTFKDYIFKFGFFFRYFPDFVKPVSKYIFNSTITIYAVLAVYGFTIFTFWRNIEKDNFYRFGCFILIAFPITLFAVLNLDRSFNHVVLSDRYGYSASAFAYIGLAVLINMFKQRIAKLILISLVILMIPLTLMETIQWGKTGKFVNESINNFPILPKDSKYFIVNLTDDFNGHIAMRDGFREALRLKRGIKIEKENLVRVADVNVYSFNDETEVKKLSNNSYKVRSTEYGKWFRNHGQGMGNYVHELYNYKCEPDQWNLSYVLTFNEPIENGYLLKAAGSDWIVVDTLSSVPNF